MIRHLRALRAAALGAALLGATPAAVHAATAAAGTAPYSTREAKVTVHDGPDGRHVATLDTRLYVPASASRSHPQPAILITHGFGLSKDAPEVTATADFLARHGYVVLAWTSQGFGASSGCIRLDSYDYDARDASDLIDAVLARRADVRHDRRGPVIGMLGGSYGGGETLLAAARDSRIRAIVPGRTWNSIQYSLYPDSWVTPGDPTGLSLQRARVGVFKREWTSLFFASGNAEPLGGLPPDGGHHGGCVEEKAASGDPTQVAGIPCLDFPAALCEVYARISATGTATADDIRLLSRSSVATFATRLRAPTLLIQGGSDTLFNENEATATYLDLRRRGVPVSMVWNSGGHGGYDSQPGECETYGGCHTGLDRGLLPRLTLAWFDRWLRGAHVGVPGFAYYRDWTKSYAAAPAYPAERSLRYTLGYGGWLTPPGLALGSGTYTIYDAGVGANASSYSETSNFSAPGSTPSLDGVRSWDAPGTFVQFDSVPFRKPVVSVGTPRAHLHLSHRNTGEDLVVFAKVYDVAPDGSATLIKRLVAPVRVPTSALHRAVDVALPGFAHEFAPGHRIRFTIATGDSAYWNSPQPDAVSLRVGAPDGYNDQYLDGGPDPSWFSIPLGDALAAQPGTPPFPWLS